jgi:predicted XRE-type DNA-binding protein
VSAVKKTPFMQWVDGQLVGDPRLAEAVEAQVAEMRLEQAIIALRERRGLSQRQLAGLLGTSQPYVAKLESGRVRNLGIRTLTKVARALGASISVRIAPVGRAAAPRSARKRGRAGGAATRTR